jgi:hypothetical protein
VRWWLVLLFGCGRVGFDAFDRTGDGGTDSSRDTATDTVTIDGALVPPGPAVWLRMETDPTAGIVDSGAGHTSSCLAGCPTLAPGKHGMGYAFVDNEVDIDPAADLQAGTGFTAAIWVKLDSVPATTVCPWNKTFDRNNGYDTFAICIDNTAAVVYDGETAGGTAVSESSAPMSLGQWHHIAVTWDGATKRDWLDGVQVAGDNLAPGAGDLGMALGASRTTFYVTGTLDDAMLYTRALSQAEIAQLAAP